MPNQPQTRNEETWTGTGFPESHIPKPAEEDSEVTAEPVAESVPEAYEPAPVEAQPVEVSVPGTPTE